MRVKTAAVGGVILATGLVGAGGTAFADSGQSAEPAPAPEPAATQAQAPADHDLIGVNAPIAADLHEGVANNASVANDLHVHDAVKDVVRVGDVVPAAAGAHAAPQANAANSGEATNDTSGNEKAGGATAKATTSSQDDQNGAPEASSEQRVDSGMSLTRPVNGVLSSVNTTVSQVVNVG